MSNRYCHSEEERRFRPASSFPPALKPIEMSLAVVGLPEQAMRGLVGEVARSGRQHHTGEPILARFNRSIASSLVKRMQPDEIADPIYSGWLVPWMR